jgi:hypothetical protein
LQLNYTNSSAALLNGDQNDATPVAAGLGCPIVELPMTYLGIPLTIHRPTSAQLQHLVEAVAAMLPTWKAWLMEKAGRLALVKSVLCMIPIHQLLVNAPAKKILKQIEKIERGFLWEARKEANGGRCHVNWRKVCRPLSNGSLGVQDMERAGLALRLRWLPFSRAIEDRAWHGLDLQFSADKCVLFFASTFMVVGDEQTVKFWEDRWINSRPVSEIAPQLYACIPKRRRKARTVADGLRANA